MIPSFYAVLGSGKAAKNIGTSFQLAYYAQEGLEHLRTLIAPIESTRYHAFFDCSSWSSTGAYLPIFGTIFVLQWCLNKNDWIKKFSVFLMICYFVPAMNSVFNLFSSTYNTRWLYGMALLFSLVSAISLEEGITRSNIINSKILSFYTLTAFILLIIPTLIYFLDKQGLSLVNRFASACITDSFFGYPALIIMLCLTAVNYLCLWYISNKKCTAQKLMMLSIALCMLDFGVYNAINYDFHSSVYSNDYYLQKALIEGADNKECVFKYRIDYPEEIVNYGLFKNQPSVNYYNSIQNHWSSKFANRVGIGDGVDDITLLTPAVGGEYTDILLSVKYFYDYNMSGKAPGGFNYLKTENNVDIYENENYIPMGFVYDSYCTEDQIGKMPQDFAAKAMLRTLVVKESDESIVSNYIGKKENFSKRYIVSTHVNQGSDNRP